MTTINIFEHTTDDVVRLKNQAMETTLATLVDRGMITNAQAVDFSSEYSFVSLKNTSMLDRLLRFFKKHGEDQSWTIFPLVKIRSNQQE